MNEWQESENIGFSNPSLRNLRIVSLCGARFVFEMIRGHFSRLEHYHAIYEMFFVMDTTLDLYFENAHYTVGPNGFALIPPWKQHLAVPKDCSQSVSVLFLLEKDTDCKTFNRLFGEATAMGARPFIADGPAESLKYLRDLCGRTDEQAFDTDIESSLYLLVFAHMARMLADAQGIALPRGGESAPADRFQRFIFINDIVKTFALEYMRDFTIDDLAKRFWVSPGHMRRLLREIYNKSFQEILTDVRMVAASQMLKNTALPIGQIAEKCGYRSYESFCKTFHKIRGMPPSTYRNQNADESGKPTRG